MSGLRQETLLGLDNVQVDLPIAPFPMRVLAGIVDYFIFGLIVTILLVASIAVMAYTETRSPWFLAALILGYFILEYGYFVALELSLAGQTPGKMLVGLRVATRLGGRASPGAILVRNAFRSIDLAIGVPFMLVHPLGQRIGDRLAESIVFVRASSAVEAVVRRVPPSWGTKEIGIAEEFLRRSASMDGSKANELAQRLLDAIERGSPGFLASAGERSPVQHLRDELGVTEVS